MWRTRNCKMWSDSRIEKCLLSQKSRGVDVVLRGGSGTGVTSGKFLWRFRGARTQNPPLCFAGRVQYSRCQITCRSCREELLGGHLRQIESHRLHQFDQVTTLTMGEPHPPISKRQPEINKFEFEPWTVSTCKSHILESEGKHKDRFDQALKLPQLPEMVFAENYLQLHHKGGWTVEFNALDALRLVNAESDPVKVAASKEWQRSRSDCEHIKNVVTPFDWTFTTTYRGTVVEDEPNSVKISTTTDRIDIEKLKQRDPIRFYDDILLYEDELSDNGSSMLSVKVRVMPSSFFVLMRFFVRVDQVLIRINDTRLYHEAGTGVMLREFSSREEQTANIPPSLHTNPNEVSKHLKLTSEILEKFEFPAS